MDEMIFKVNNVGPISNSIMKLGKVNIIKGPIDSGKSFLSKLLFCFLTSNSKERTEIINHSLDKQILNLTKLINSTSFSSYIDNIETQQFINEILNLAPTTFRSNSLNQNLELFGLLNNLNIENETFNNNLKICEDIINILDDEELLFKYVIRYLLNLEFGSTDFKGNCSFEGYFKDKNYDSLINFDTSSYNSKRLANFNNVLYLNGDFNLDDLSSEYYNSMKFHSSKLVSLLKYQNKSKDAFDEIYNKELIKIEEAFSNLLGGRFIYIKNELYFEKAIGEVVSLGAVSSAISNMGVLQLLLSNRCISEDSFLIIDGLENGLDINYKIKLADILVLLAKELNISILISSSDEKFIEAITLCSKKYDLYDDTKLFINEFINISSVIVKDVSNEIDKAFDNTLDPLESLRAEITLKESKIKEDSKVNAPSSKVEIRKLDSTSSYDDKKKELSYKKNVLKELEYKYDEIQLKIQNCEYGLGDDCYGSPYSFTELKALKLKALNVKRSLDEYNQDINKLESELDTLRKQFDDDKYIECSFYNLNLIIESGIKNNSWLLSSNTVSTLVPNNLNRSLDCSVDGKKYSAKLNVFFRLFIEKDAEFIKYLYKIRENNDSRFNLTLFINEKSICYSSLKEDISFEIVANEHLKESGEFIIPRKFITPFLSFESDCKVTVGDFNLSARIYPMVKGYFDKNALEYINSKDSYDKVNLKLIF